MDEHGLPIVGAGVDYTKVPALEHKNTLSFLNKFIIHTTQFLNKFSNVCEERLSELSGRIQSLDISLNILEAKLSSIADLNGVQATTQYEPPANVAAAGGASTAASGTTGSGSAAPAAPSSSSGPPPPASTQDGPIPAPEAAGSEPIPPPQPEAQASKGKKAKDDPRYLKFFRMKRMGVNPLQIAMEMKGHGLNPDILEDEDAVLPDDDQGGGSMSSAMNKNLDSSDDEEDDDDDDSTSSSGDQDSDDSFGSD